MRILVVIPKFVQQKGTYYPFPIGIPSIAAALKKAGFAVECLNLNHIEEPAAQTVSRKIDAKEIDIVCCGGLSREYHAINEVFTGARTATREVINIAGGGIISSEPKLIMGALPIDLAVYGEGEDTIVDLAQTLADKGDLQTVAGILYRADGRIMKTSPRGIITDLGQLPFPDFASFDIATYLDFQLPNDTYFMYPFDKPRFISMTLSRACPFSCTFCYHPLGNRYRQRSLDSFFAELDSHIDQFQVNMISIIDELFMVDLDRVMEFCRRISQYNLKWIASMRVDRISLEILHELKRAGMISICYGLESCSDTILKSMRKKITYAQIENAYAITKEANIAFTGNLLLGDPEETNETANETLDWWEKHQYDFINVHKVIPYPGSALYKHCLQEGLITDRLEYIKAGCPVINMTSMSSQEMQHVVSRSMKILATGRKFGRILSVVKQGKNSVKQAFLYTIELECPHCGARMTYRNFYKDDQLMIEKIGCKNCNLRIDLMPAIFDHIFQVIAPARAKIKYLIDNGMPVSITPCVYEYDFIERMQIMDADYRDLDIRYFLDANPDPEKLSPEFAARYPLLERTARNLQEKCAGHTIIVLPSVSHKQIIESLLASGISKENILSLNIAGHNIIVPAT